MVQEITIAERSEVPILHLVLIDFQIHIRGFWQGHYF